MSMPYYVAPEQVMKDRADYARKGIARGRSLVATQFADGIAIVAENPSTTLRKVSEIYDRIAFAGVGKYNEFDQLRIAGVRAADLKGFSYSREDVDARSLGNQYAQILGQVFTHEMKPMEVEILVAEVGLTSADDQFFHILYDGTVMDEDRFTAVTPTPSQTDSKRPGHLNSTFRRSSLLQSPPWRAQTALLMQLISRSQSLIALANVALSVVLNDRNSRISFRRTDSRSVTLRLAVADSVPVWSGGSSG